MDENTLAEFYLPCFRKHLHLLPKITHKIITKITEHLPDLLSCICRILGFTLFSFAHYRTNPQLFIELMDFLDGDTSKKQNY